MILGRVVLAILLSICVFKTHCADFSPITPNQIGLILQAGGEECNIQKSWSGYDMASPLYLALMF